MRRKVKQKKVDADVVDRGGRSRRWTERLVGADEGGHPDGWMVKEADSWTARKPDRY